MMVPETLWLAPTRPAMRQGVPVEAFFINVFATFAGGMLAGSPFYWLLGLVFHYALFRPLAAWDPTFFRVLRLWLATKGNTPGTARYGAPALLALSVTRPRGAEYPSCV